MIIPDLSRDIVLKSIKQEISKMDDKNLKRRMKFVDFYEGEHEPHIKSYFEKGPQLPLYTANITKRMVNARSLAYKDSPLRSNERYNDALPHDINSKMRQMEKMTFLLGSMGLISRWDEDHLEYDILPYFWPIFVSGSIDVKAVYYPLANLNDRTNRIYEYWSDEEHFRFDQKGKVWNLDDDGINLYGRMPVTFAHRDPELVDEFFQCGASDIVSANEHLDILMQEIMIAARIDSLGIKYATNIHDDTPIRAGVDEVIMLPDGATLNRLEGGDPQKLLNVAKSIIQSTALNNHLVARFVDSESSSGIALKIENIENWDARKASVNDVWRPFEHERFKLDREIAAYHGVNIDDDFAVDFKEPDQVMDKAEERAHFDWMMANGFMTKKQVMKAMNQDKLSDEEIDEILTEAAVEVQPEKPTSVLEALIA